MGRKHIPGLIMRAGIWHIDKRILGRRVCQSTGRAQLEEAETHLAHCSYCARRYRFEAELRMFVRQATADEPMPPELKEKLANLRIAL